MESTRIVRIVAVLAMTATLSACAIYKPPFPIPEEAGLYVMTGGENLQRLDGNADWENTTWPERSSLAPTVKFVVSDPSIASDPATAAGRVELWRVAWVRSEIGTNHLAMPVSGSSWALARLDPFRVSFTTMRAPRSPQAMLIVPTEPLSAGLYAFRLNSQGVSREARLGVLWNSVDQRQYSAVNCVDRYLGSAATYQTCMNGSDTQQAATQKTKMPAPASNGLTITLDKPVQNDMGVLIRGVVTNTTAHTKHLPLLQVTLQDASGQAIRRSIIQPSAAELGPGQRLIFKDQILNGAGAAKVNVKFVPELTTGS